MTGENHGHETIKSSSSTAGIRYIKLGLLFATFGMAIAIVASVSAAPWFTYVVASGAIGFGSVGLVRGMSRFSGNGDPLGIVVKWSVGSVAVLGLVLWASLTVLDRPDAEEVLSMPPDRHVQWVDGAIQVSEPGKTNAFAGTVRNLDGEWFVSSARVQFTVSDGAGNVISTFDVPVMPTDIAPGTIGSYATSLVTKVPAYSYDAELSWEWSPTTTEGQIQ